MADDELLVNFHLDAGPPTRTQSFKGGTWKDRLTARKSAEYNRQKAARKHEEQDIAPKDGLGGNHPMSVDASVRPVKRQRVEPNGKPVGQSSQHTGPKTPRQVVSSLFSFNPTSKSLEGRSAGRNTEDDTETQPSNAPSKDQLDTFTSLGLSPELSEFLLKKLEITAPTAIQRRAVKQLVSDDTDAFIQAQTGSGKTLAYLLPIVQRLVNLSTDGSKLYRNSGLFAIILAPTRELSKQISIVLESLLRYAHWLVSGTVIGGEKKKSEKARLRKGLNILIATPGRLVDHLDNTEVLDVSNVRWLVLDEGDRLMELGFDQDIQKILSALNLRASRNGNVEGLPAERTTVLCSATMKMNVQKLGAISLKDAVHIQAERTESDTVGEGGSNEDGFSAPAQLHQSYVTVPAKLRLVALTALLKRTFARKGSVMKVIVFMTCADSVDFHFDIFSKQTGETTDDPPKDSGEPLSKRDAQLKSFKTRADATEISTKDNTVHIFRLHGSLPQIVRTATLLAFRNSKEPSFLVCTDVAARGLDLPNVDLVIEYDPPFQKEDHLHRIGRTARAGKDGRASIFLQPGSEEGYVKVLKDVRHEGGREPHEANVNDLLKRGFGSSKLGGKDWEEQATQWQLDIERWVLDEPKRLEMARQAYQSHIRAYATHVAAERHMFDMASLHLGHLAKAFALRDKPGSIRVPGLRPTNQDGNAVKAERRSQARKDAGGPSVPGEDIPGATDIAEASRKMRQKIKQQSGVSEFNLG